MGGHPLRSPTRRRLGRPLPYQLADGPQAPPKAAGLLQPLEHGFKTRAPHAVLAVLSNCYSPLPGRSPTCYAPIRHSTTPCGAVAFDLHVLSTPPAFILSQDRTLRMKLQDAVGRSRLRPGFILRQTFRPAHPSCAFPLVLLPITLQLLRCRAPLSPGARADGLYHTPLPPVKTLSRHRRKTDAALTLTASAPGVVHHALLFGFARARRAKRRTGEIIDT